MARVVEDEEVDIRTNPVETKDRGQMVDRQEEAEDRAREHKPL